jgi:hypothetical protein
VTVLEYLFITGFSFLFEEHVKNALEVARTAGFLDVWTKSFDMPDAIKYQRLPVLVNKISISQRRISCPISPM